MSEEFATRPRLAKTEALEKKGFALTDDNDGVIDIEFERANRVEPCLVQ
jgi:hypothetical protein